MAQAVLAARQAIDAFIRSADLLLIKNWLALPSRRRMLRALPKMQPQRALSKALRLAPGLIVRCGAEGGRSATGGNSAHRSSRTSYCRPQWIESYKWLLL